MSCLPLCSLRLRSRPVHAAEEAEAFIHGGQPRVDVGEVEVTLEMEVLEAPGLTTT